MKRNMKEQDITKALRQMAKAKPEEAVFDRVWYKLEEHIDARRNHAGRHITWKPWGHPVRWVMAACFCLALTGTFYHQISVSDNEDVAEYLQSVSNPTANVGHDLGMVNVPILLTGPSTTNANLLKEADDEHSNVLAGDEILL